MCDIIYIQKNIEEIESTLLNQAKFDIPARADYDPTKLIPVPWDRPPVVQPEVREKTLEDATNFIREGVLTAHQLREEYKCTAEEARDLGLTETEVEQIKQDAMNEVHVSENYRRNVEMDQWRYLRQQRAGADVDPRLVDPTYIPDYSEGDADLDDAFAPDEDDQ